MLSISLYTNKPHCFYKPQYYIISLVSLSLLHIQVFGTNCYVHILPSHMGHLVCCNCVSIYVAISNMINEVWRVLYPAMRTRSMTVRVQACISPWLFLYPLCIM